MSTPFIIWLIAGIVLVFVAAVLGRFAANRGWLGFLVDSRGRDSLTQFQLYLWTFIIVSPVCAFFFGRLLLGGTKTPIDFGIPSAVWALLGIAAGSTVTAVAVKSQKDASNPASVATSFTLSQAARNAGSVDDPPRLSQNFLVEEGAMADQVIDVTKFQNFWFTIILAATYISMAVTALEGVKTGADLKSLPDLSRLSGVARHQSCRLHRREATEQGRCRTGHEHDARAVPCGPARSATSAVGAAGTYSRTGSASCRCPSSERRLAGSTAAQSPAGSTLKCRPT